jgi:hypothetical protein
MYEGIIHSCREIQDFPYISFILSSFSYLVMLSQASHHSQLARQFLLQPRFYACIILCMRTPFTLVCHFPFSLLIHHVLIYIQYTRPLTRRKADYSDRAWGRRILEMSSSDPHPNSAPTPGSYPAANGRRTVRNSHFDPKWGKSVPASH